MHTLTEKESDIDLKKKQQPAELLCDMSIKANLATFDNFQYANYTSMIREKEDFSFRNTADHQIKKIK